MRVLGLSTLLRILRRLLRMESSTPVTRLINEMESLFGTSINRGLGDSIWGLRMTLLRSELFMVCGTTPTTRRHGGHPRTDCPLPGILGLPLITYRLRVSMLSWAMNSSLSTIPGVVQLVRMSSLVLVKSS